MTALSSSSPPRVKKLAAPNSATKLFRKNKGGHHRKTKSLTSSSNAVDTNKGTKESSEDVKRDGNNLTPPRPVRRTISATNTPNVPLFAHVLPWHKRKSKQEHRKTPSVSSVPDPFSAVPVPQSSLSASSSPVVPPPELVSISSSKTAVTSMSPMIQELYQLEQQQQQQQPDKQSLFLPSLAKPRPTSFLTGQLDEAFRSSEQDPTPWQLEMPSHADVLVKAKLCQFLETYAVDECPLDFNQLVGVPRMDMQRFAQGDDIKLVGSSGTVVSDCHRPVVESLLECGRDIAEVKGFFSTGGPVPDDRREVLVVERQNKFLCVFRGSAAEQQGKFPRNGELVSLKDGSNAKVLNDRFQAFCALQGDLFRLLDQLTEESPFCDITFTGHSYGAALATLAAYTYANSHTALRVACHVTACPRLGECRLAVHSTPNLCVWRTELGRHSSVPQRWAVGHCARILLHKDGRPAVVQAFKFGAENQDTLVAGASAVRSFLAQGKERGIHEYIDVLEDVVPEHWAKDFYKEDGAGVRGKDNEAREMA